MCHLLSIMTKFTHYFSNSNKVPNCIELEGIGHQINSLRFLVWKEVEGRCHIKINTHILNNQRRNTINSMLQLYHL